MSYDKETGVFIWINKRPRSNAKVGSIVGSIDAYGYLRVKFKGKIYKLHRLAWLYMYGEFPDGDIDHINHNKLDNRISNLRVVTPRENTYNKPKSKNNTSGVTGVYWCRQTKKWKASIRVDGEFIHLGYYALFSDAVNARKNAEILYGFHSNHGKDV